jgi:hypothetical protein
VQGRQALEGLPEVNLLSFQSWNQESSQGRCWGLGHTYSPRPWQVWPVLAFLALPLRNFFALLAAITSGSDINLHELSSAAPNMSGSLCSSVVFYRLNLGVYFGWVNDFWAFSCIASLGGKENALVANEVATNAGNLPPLLIVVHAQPHSINKWLIFIWNYCLQGFQASYKAVYFHRESQSQPALLSFCAASTFPFCAASRVSL